MKKVLKQLKPYTFLIILVIALLFVQAMADLSLPEYMSRIVNVGIQQQGIEDTVPMAIRDTQYEKIKVFIDEEDLKLFEESYSLITLDDSNRDNEYEETYHYLRDGNIYILNEIDEETYNSLSKIMERSLLVIMAIENDELKSDEPNPMLDSLPEGMDIYTAISAMAEENKNEILTKIDEEMSKLPDMYSDQGVIRFIYDEYVELGMDVDKMQLNFIISVGGKMLLIALLVMVVAISVLRISTRVATGFARNLRTAIFEKVMKFSNAEFNNFSTASLITRSTNDISQITQFVAMMLRMVFYAPILGIGGVIKALETNTSMAWVVGLGVVVILLLVILLFSFITPKFNIAQKVLDKLNLVTRESLTGMLVIRAFNNEEYEEDKFEDVNKELTGINLFISRSMVSMMPSMNLVLNILMLVIVWVGAHQIDQATIQIGDMMAFMQYAMQIIMSFLMLSMVSIILPRAAVSLKRIGELLDQEIIIEDPENPIEIEDVKGKVEFEDVSFRYPGAEECILKDINFSANPGEMTAFIGSTGSGKTSIVNLIPRLFDVTDGSVKIDGVDIRDMEISDLRDLIGYVPQQALLFAGDIESNIKFGKNENIDLDGVNRAIEISQSKEFVSNYDKGVNSPISQGGTNVSGGQRQRLSIARAIASEPKILIFDDSFSALDFKTDKELRKALKENLGDSTMLVVAQRISTIKDAENIIVLDEGEIVGQGKHRDLLKTCTVYQQIAKSQLSEEELAYE